MAEPLHGSRLPHPVALLALIAALAGAWALGARAAGGQDREGSLRNQIERRSGRERSLASAVARLGKLERATAREVAVLQRRVAAVQSELSDAEAILRSSEERRAFQRNRALRLRSRLRRSRAQLGELLRQRYAGGKPDIVTVILNSNGFAELQETVDFLKRIQRQDERILDNVRGARIDARAAAAADEARRPAAQRGRRRPPPPRRARHDRRRPAPAPSRAHAGAGGARSTAARHAHEPQACRARAGAARRAAQSGPRRGRPEWSVGDPVAGRAV